MHPPSRGRALVDERPGGRPPRTERPGAVIHQGFTPVPAGGSPRENKTGTGRRKAGSCSPTPVPFGLLFVR